MLEKEVFLKPNPEEDLLRLLWFVELQLSTDTNCFLFVREQKLNHFFK